MRWSSASVVLLVVMAGCAGSGDDPPVADIEPPSEGKGSIYGVVVDGTVNPVANVTVRITGQEMSDVSDANGAVRFSDLEPGTYFLTAEGEGITSVQTSADVQAGQVTQVKMQVALEAVAEPYHRSNLFTARHATSVPFLTVYYVSPVTEVDGPFESVVYEADWSQSSLVLYPMDDTPYFHELSAGSWERSNRTGEQAIVTYNGSGYDPGHEDAGELRLRTYPYSALGVSADAKAEVFITIFYHAPAPEGWSIIEGTGTPE